LTQKQQKVKAAKKSAKIYIALRKKNKLTVQGTVQTNFSSDGNAHKFLNAFFLRPEK
jgi:hypothetical protein